MSDAPSSPDGVEEAHKSTLARLRHDLRTPLNQIIGYSELLVETVDEHDISDVVPPLEEIHRAGTDMLGKLNDELAPWKVQSGQVSLPNLQAQLLDPLRLVEDACSRCSEIAGRQGAVDVVDDLSKIREAVTNLRRGLNVTIEDEPKETDTGPSIPAMESHAPVSVRATETGKLLVVDDDHLNREMIARRCLMC